ncbi:unnamed protein product [Amoebophrya sp. A25]|nr:unnamed protein product [Amoebophrya sp. A25]|eukprot:GSA25T00014399001.1
MFGTLTTLQPKERQEAGPSAIPVISRVIRSHMEKSGAYVRMEGWASLEEYNPEFFEVNKKDTSLTLRRRKHKWCFLKVMLKDRVFKDIGESIDIDAIAYRPLTSYYSHAWKLIFKRAAQVVDWLISKEASMATTTKGFLHIVNNYNDRCLEFVADLMEEKGCSFEEAFLQLPAIEVETHDIKDFFTACNTKIAIQLIRERVQHYKKQGFKYFVLQTEKAYEKRVQYHNTTRKQIIKANTTVDFSVEKPRREVSVSKFKPIFAHWISLDGLRNILQHDISHVFVRSHGKLFRQVSGGPMGSPTMCALANSFGCQQERVWRSKVSKEERPSMHKRYVDDSFSIKLKTLAQGKYPTYQGCKLKDTTAEAEFLGMNFTTFMDRLISLKPKHESMWKVLPPLSYLTNTQRKGLERGKLVRRKLNSTHFQT